MGSARLRFSGEVKETPAPSPLIQLTEELPQELRGLPEPVLIQTLTPVGVTNRPSVPSPVEKPQAPQAPTPPQAPQAPAPPSPTPPTAGPQMNQPNAPQPGTAPTQQAGGGGGGGGGTTQDTGSLIQVNDDHLLLAGAEIPYALTVQVGATAVVTAATTAIAGVVSTQLSAALDSLRARMNAREVEVNKNPLSKLTGVFVDSRPKIIIRRVKRPSGKEVMVFEEFDGKHTSVLLAMKKLDGEKVSISDLKDILETISHTWRTDLNVKIDSELMQFFDEDERALWKKYFKRYSELFRGVR